MQTFLVFNVQFTLALMLVGWITRTYLWPRLIAMPTHEALALSLLPGATRFMGLTFLVDGVTPQMPGGFGWPAGLGDTASALIAMAAIVACRSGSGMGKSLAWLYVVGGGLDLLVGLGLGFQYALWNHLGGAWTYIVFAFPMVVTSLIVSVMLLRRRSAAA